MNPIQFLDNLADQLDAMVQESKTGGWSTNLCDRLTALANDCRREAAQLRRSERNDDSRRF